MMDNGPVFMDIRAGLEHLDMVRDQEVERQRMEAAAYEAMERDQGDPTKQSYFVRRDRGTVVKTEEEYDRLSRAGVKMEVVPYSTALQLVNEEKAKRKPAKKRKANKAAKQARKRNR